jgi:hypothetical protein
MGMSEQMMSVSSVSNGHDGGHLYMQTNETRNAIVHYLRSANGAPTEVERVATGGAGSGLISSIYHIARPNHFEGAGSVILTPDRRFLFATNGGDNSVSSFAVGNDGWLTLLDVKRTGNTTNGGAKSVAYAPSSRTLFVVHTFGPDHVRLMSVDDAGNLTLRPEQHSVSTMEWPNRVPTMAVLSPDEKYLLLGTTFDELPTAKNPDGSLILWIPKNGSGLHSIASNAPDPDGIIVFPVGADGALAHHLDRRIPEDVAFDESRIRNERSRPKTFCRTWVRSRSFPRIVKPWAVLAKSSCGPGRPPTNEAKVWTPARRARRQRQFQGASPTSRSTPSTLLCLKAFRRMWARFCVTCYGAAECDAPMIDRHVNVRGVDARVPEKLVEDVTLQLSIALHSSVPLISLRPGVGDRPARSDGRLRGRPGNARDTAHAARTRWRRLCKRPRTPPGVTG